MLIAAPPKKRTILPLPFLRCKLLNYKQAGEGNRTLVCSLGSCRSTIELHPQSNKKLLATEFDFSKAIQQPETFTAICRDWGARRCSKRKIPCQVPRTIFPLETGTTSLVRVSHTDVGRHVIRTLKRVGIAQTIFRNQALEETYQVTRSGRVSVFKNNETRAGVTDKNGDHSLANGCALQDALHLGGNFVESLAAR